jgi:hypothetical protein
MRTLCAGLSLSILVVAVSPAIAQVSTGSIGIEIGGGLGLGSSPLGVTTNVPEGYFSLGDVSPAPVFAVGLLLPSVTPGVRPQARISLMPRREVAGSWIPCYPGVGCPKIYHPLDAHVDRWQATAGVELALTSSLVPVLPYARLGLGVRRYGLSWEQVGASGDAFLLNAGTTSEIDFLLALSLGAAVSLGGSELTLEGSADRSSFGPGTIPVLDDVAPASSTLDLGREATTQFALSVGLRKYLD